LQARLVDDQRSQVIGNLIGHLLAKSTFLASFRTSALDDRNKTHPTAIPLSMGNGHGRVRVNAVRLQAPSMSEDPTHTAPTLFLLMAQYNGQTVVPLDRVCRDFFGHLTVEKLLRKALRGDIALPIVRIETSQKAQRGVHLVDLAAYIDKRRAAAIKECRQLTGTT
jgi:Pyocin activator protein PrtN